MARVADSGGRPVSGQAPFLMVAVVVDNVDPDGLGRIKVKFPTLPGEPQSFWMRQITPNGGAVGGFYALPEKGDEVIVSFLQGHQDYGVIVGQLWNGTTKPPKEAADGMPGSGKTDTGANWSRDRFNDGSGDIQNNDRRFWRTRAGHILCFDDTKGKESVQIWDGSHTRSIVLDMKESRILITNAKGDIHLRAKQDVFLEAGRDVKLRAARHIEGESGQKTQHKAGTQILVESGTDTQFKAGTNFKVDARVNVDIKGGVNVKIEGIMLSARGIATTSLQGGASVAVRGGLVSIN
jgi:uncharacterized protein involved in type VI secretion and phage assembly